MDTKNNNPVVVAGIVLVIVLAVFLGYKFTPHRDVIVPADTPNTIYLKKMAVQCQGNINNLPEADRQKVQQISGNYAAFNMQNYYSLSKSH